MAPLDSHPETDPRPTVEQEEIDAMCREPDFCERCQRFDELVACIGPDGALLAMICEDCATEYIYSGLDEPDGYVDARGD